MTPIELNPEFLTKNGEKQFAILPYTEFVALKEWIEDVEDLLDLREARESDDGSPSLSIEEVKKRIGNPLNMAVLAILRAEEPELELAK